LWYARAVGALRQRNLSQRSSWVYLAALHGIDPQGWIAQGILPAGSPAPTQNEMRLMFNQCQHAGWFFVPWHRGYLAAFEEILAAWISSQGGPDDWALPYWNYLGTTSATPRDMPAEFQDPTLPDGSANPLADALRGPSKVLGPVPWLPDDITLNAQTAETEYTSEPGALGYGGPISGFTQQGNAYGAVESNPHNYVHVMIGGDTSQNPQGWMYDPNYAALDPIFWVHHCNIDRLWAAWMAHAGNNQEKSKPWRNGPFPRQFTMPDAAGNLNVFIPEDTLPGGRLEPKYDDIVNGTGLPAPTPGVTMAAAPSATPGSSSLVAANDASLSVAAAPVQSRLRFAPRGAHTGLAASTVRAERYYLNVEGVRGVAASGVLTARISAPGQADASLEATKTLVFFGLANASSTDGPHAGNGLSATVEITDITDRLLARTGGSLDGLDVQLSQPQGSDVPITVERISIYSRRSR